MGKRRASTRTGDIKANTALTGNNTFKGDVMFVSNPAPPPMTSAGLEVVSKGQHSTHTLQSTSNFRSLGLTKNPVFTGREAEMLLLRAAMFLAPTADKKTAARGSALTQGFTGEGGIGKSQLAQRFAERACAALRDASEAAEEDWNRFDCAWWLDCSKDGHGPAVQALAEHLGHAPTSKDTPATFRAAVRARLDAAKRHLFILDNLDELDLAAMNAHGEETRWARAEGWSLPPGSRLLITTRAQNLPERFGACVKLDVLSREDARTLLRGTRADLRDTGHEKPDTALHADLDAVTAYLGHLALAVDMARAYLHLHPGRSPVTLLAELKASDAAAIALFESDELKDEAHRYRLSVARSLSLHIDALAGTPAEQLLFAAAFAAPDRIPAELLRAAAGVDESETDKGLSQLHAKSIVHHQPGPDGGLVSLHRLTQLVVRARLAKADTDGTSRVLAGWFRAISKLHEGDDHDEVRPKRTAAAVHVAAAADHALQDSTVAVTHHGAADCHLKNARHYLIIGDLASAESAINKAVRWADGQGADSTKILMVFLASRARMRQNRGDLVGAEADLKRSIDWGESQTPRYERNLAIDYASRASIRLARGDLVRAEDDLKRSIDWGESQTPRDERSLSIWYASRASIRLARGDLARAEDDLKRSIDWGKSQTPRNERGLSICYASRAGIRLARGDLVRAEADLKRSIDWGESQTPRDERSLAILYAYRARIRHDQAVASREAGEASTAAALFAQAKTDIAGALAWYEANLPGDERTIGGMRETKARIEKAERGER